MAVPLLAVPAKSQGAFFSIKRGEPVICGSSRKNRTLLIPEEAGTKMYTLPVSTEPSSGTGEDRSEERLTSNWWVDGAGGELSPTVKVALVEMVEPSERSIDAVTIWDPGARLDALNAFAVPFFSVPAKSHGAFFSIKRGEPLIWGSSRKNRTLVIPAESGTKM
ncbi:MAG: hypothetical protein ACRDIW_09280 [Actinomycetota bacterium]